MDAILPATRFLAWVLLLCNAAILAHYLRHRIRGGDSVGSETAITATTAILLKTVGWSIHQIFWWHWEVARGAGNIAVKVILENGQYIILGSYVLIIGGGLLLASIYVRRVVPGVHWSVPTLMAALAVWSCGMWLV